MKLSQRKLADKLVAPCLLLPVQVPLIHLAAATNLVEVYKAVLGAGADPLTQTDALGRSALHFAAAKGATATAELLLDTGSLQAADKQKNTPLHLAGALELPARASASACSSCCSCTDKPVMITFQGLILAIQQWNRQQVQQA